MDDQEPTTLRERAIAAHTEKIIAVEGVLAEREAVTTFKAIDLHRKVFGDCGELTLREVRLGIGLNDDVVTLTVEGMPFRASLPRRSAAIVKWNVAVLCDCRKAMWSPSFHDLEGLGEALTAPTPCLHNQDANGLTQG